MSNKSMTGRCQESDLIRRAQLRPENIPKEIKYPVLFKHEFLDSVQGEFEEHDFILYKFADITSPSGTVELGFWGKIAASVLYPFRELLLIWKDLRLLMIARWEVRRARETIETDQQYREYFTITYSDTDDQDRLLWTFNKVDPPITQKHPAYMDWREEEALERLDRLRKLYGSS